ncbi:hypothetical protein V1512DRAFT_265004 [Lipomyces arxii]|uniref:uncharacterized protein n=1 Tax=Lipomyces arxii TaxID=56418 RepID=UPI0034CD930B
MPMNFLKEWFAGASGTRSTKNKSERLPDSEAEWTDLTVNSDCLQNCSADYDKGLCTPELQTSPLRARAVETKNRTPSLELIDKLDALLPEYDGLRTQAPNQTHKSPMVTEAIETLNQQLSPSGKKIEPWNLLAEFRELDIRLQRLEMLEMMLRVQLFSTNGTCKFMLQPTLINDAGRIDHRDHGDESMELLYENELMETMLTPSLSSPIRNLRGAWFKSNLKEMLYPGFCGTLDEGRSTSFSFESLDTEHQNNVLMPLEENNDSADEYLDEESEIESMSDCFSYKEYDDCDEDLCFNENDELGESCDDNLFMERLSCCTDDTSSQSSESDCTTIHTPDLPTEYDIADDQEITEPIMNMLGATKNDDSFFQDESTRAVLAEISPNCGVMNSIGKSRDKPFINTVKKVRFAEWTEVREISIHKNSQDEIF